MEERPAMLSQRMCTSSLCCEKEIAFIPYAVASKIFYDIYHTVHGLSCFPSGSDVTNIASMSPSQSLEYRLTGLARLGRSGNYDSH